MSAFRFKVSPKLKGTYGKIRSAHELRSMRRMIANGSTEQHAYQVIAAARAVREAKKKEAES